MPRRQGVRVRRGLHTRRRERQATNVVDGWPMMRDVRDDSCRTPRVRERHPLASVALTSTVRSSACLRATSTRTIDSRYRRCHSLGCKMTCPTVCARGPDRTSATAAHPKATDTAIDDGASTAHPHRSQHLRPRPAVQRTTATLNGHDPIPVGSSVSNVTAHLRAVAALVPLVCHQVEHLRRGPIDADVTCDHHGLLPDVSDLHRAVPCRVARRSPGRAKRRSGDRCVRDTAGPCDGPAPQQEDVRPWASRCHGGKV